ncbi:MAG: helix-turn-helix transcriptional regulator [Aquabacterium sp.]|uniref:helix-turn-helix transcriptional regulator n=1 Tax=Aquabacterium sp. TaxID=1872578 RepID=UPI0025C60AAB|nr:helix-turn-helix transcriptional regulator [Aquabacterium sp.]MBI3383383.1 helix-turn-helix transcriptional regulator [Aquabacterium sp.]
MTKENYELSQFELGERLRSARETANLTQDVAAKAAGLSRTTLVAIEKGHRAAKLMELQDLCRSYGVSVNSILRRESVHVDLVPRFRTLAETGEPCIDTAARLLNDLVKAEVELENILGVQKTYNYPAEKSILAGDVRQQAEQDALNLRNWLGLGDGPIRDLYVILELQLGIRVYTRKLDGKVSGLQVWEPHFDWVVAQIGPANVPLCPSLRRLAKRVRVTTAQ